MNASSREAEAPRPALSVVIPLFNEAESLPELHEQLVRALDPLGQPFELIFIDDGSRDGSFDVLTRLHRDDHRVKVIQFRRNYGKSAALAVGFAQAHGETVVTIDADLQDDPQEIPRLIAQLDAGYDLVSGWKQHRRDPWTKTLPSKVFNRVTAAVSGLRLHDFNCGLKAYRHEVVETIPVYGELHRYLPMLAHWAGFRAGELPITHRTRKYGKSKFGPGRFAHGLFDLLTVLFLSKYTRRPLHLFGLIGLLSFGAGVGIGLYMTALWVSKIAIGTRPLLLFGVLLMLLGIQLVSIGLVGEMIANAARRNEDYAIRARLE